MTNKPFVVSLMLLAGACAAPPSGETNSDAETTVASGLAACQQAHQLPVVTHWSNTTRSRVPYASDDARDVLTKPYPNVWYAPGNCYPYYGVGSYPTVDHYVADTWSTTGVSDSEAKAIVEKVCSDSPSHVPIRLMRPDRLAELKENSGVVQVVSSLVVDQGLVTVILPANWRRALAATYPIVVNSFYDNNLNLFYQEGPDVMRMISRSTTEGRSGAIGVLWNGGGAAASRTLSPHALDQFASVVDYVVNTFGGDRHRLLMFGYSRGGAATLLMASNPHHHNYTVTYAAPAVTPAVIGSHAQLQSWTFPALLEGVSWTTGFHDAWRTGWRYPACGGHPELTGLTAQQAHVAVLTGTTDFAYADANLSLDSPQYIAGLKAANTKIYLQAGTHDFIVPYMLEVQYAIDLMNAGIPLRADVLVRTGHTRRLEDAGVGTMFQETASARIWEALQSYVNPAGLPFNLDGWAPGISYYRVNRSAQTLESFTPASFPFTLEGPRRIPRGARFPFVLVGQANTAWQVTLRRPSEQAPAYVWSGTIGEKDSSVVWVDVPVDFPLGDLVYGLSIQVPGQGWKAIPATNSIDGSEARVTVLANEPYIGAIGDAGIAAFASGTSIPHFEGTNWGLSEY